MNHYLSNLASHFSDITPEKIDRFVEILSETIRNDRSIYLCGNGGSASTAEHFSVDLAKGVSLVLDKPVKAFSLTSNISMITAIANDISFESIFELQFKNFAIKGDVLICISVSGQSKNILTVAQFAFNNGFKVLSLIGKDGGDLKKFSTEFIVINSNNYGVVEDLHLSCCHQISDLIKHTGNKLVPDF